MNVIDNFEIFHSLKLKTSKHFDVQNFLRLQVETD
jgi:hypothetical protein